MSLDAYINGTFMPLDQASLHVSDLAIQRGYGIFDFFRVKNHVPLYLNDYLDRFYRSAEMMGLQGVMERDSLKKTIYELIERNGIPDAGMKMILTGGYSPDAYQPTKGNFILSEHVLVLPTAAQIEQGIKVITYPYRRELPEVKTINYIMGVWLLSIMKEQSAVDVLYHQDGVVSEFPRCNFFMVTRNGVLVTPDKYVLHGITRKKILQVAEGVTRVELRTVKLDEVRQASEAFLTSTTKKILPIVRMDNTVIGSGAPGPITVELLKALSVLEETEINKEKEPFKIQ